jgi:hypothetical protein
MLATSDPTLAFSGIPTIPVRVWREEGQWRKQPLAEWDRATIDEDQITAWSRKWLDARPGVPLAKVGWAVVDVDDPECAAFWEVWNGLGPRGPYSKVRTISGGWHFVLHSRRNQSLGSSGARVLRSLAPQASSPSTTQRRSCFLGWLRGRCCRKCSGSRWSGEKCAPLKTSLRLLR